GSLTVGNQQIMSLDGVDIGLEICLDHYHRALKNTVLGNPPRTIDVQLLVGCGSDIVQESVAARSNGLALRCNGNKYQPPPGKEYQVGDWPNGTPALNEMPPLSDLTSTRKILPLPPNLQIRPATTSDTAGYFDPIKL